MHTGIAVLIDRTAVYREFNFYLFLESNSEVDPNFPFFDRIFRSRLCSDSRPQRVAAIALRIDNARSNQLGIFYQVSSI